MKTLHLNLKKKWFDMILLGHKKQEYRDLKPFWASRFFQKKHIGMTIDFWRGFMGKTINNKRIYDIKKERIGYGDIFFNNFDTITFSNGYAKNRPQFEIELKNISIGTGNPEWGAKRNVKYFVLELGEIKK